jgi:hypothetical protein
VGRDRHQARHGIGARPVYGRWRVHTVTWLDCEDSGLKALRQTTTRLAGR